VLLAVPGVLSVAQVGNALRVLSAPEAGSIDSLRDGLRQAGVEAEVEAAAPNLEDVFVAATQREGDVDRRAERA